MASPQLEREAARLSNRSLPKFNFPYDPYPLDPNPPPHRRERLLSPLGWWVLTIACAAGAALSYWVQS